MEKPNPTPDEQTATGNLILAFQGQPAVQQLVAATVANGKSRPLWRTCVLETMARSTMREVPAAWVEALETALSDSDVQVRQAALRTSGVLQVPQLDEQFAALAENEKESADVRREALRAVVARRPKLSDSAFEFLAKQLDQENNPLARLGAAEVFARTQLTETKLRRLVPLTLGDTLIAPGVILPALLRSATDATAPLVFEYLKDALQSGWRPSETELNAALRALPGGQAHAKELFDLRRESIESQAARLAHFEPLLTGGDARGGREVFAGRKVACANCHRVGSDGGHVGPDLTRVGTVRSGRDLLESIILPSSTIAQGYESLAVETTDGRIMTGTISGQSGDMLTLRDSSGAEVRLRRDLIQEMRRQATSIMPEGLEKTLSAHELRDLLAYLQSLK